MIYELLYCGIENRRHCIYFSLYLSIFLSFQSKFVSHYFRELFTLISSNGKLKIVSWDVDSVSLLTFFYFIKFFLSPSVLSTWKVFVIVFQGTIEARILKLDKHMENELLHREIDKRAHCASSSHFSVFLR